MPDQDIIFKLQLDTSGYITGVNAAADVTTAKFVAAQRRANDALLASKKALADVTQEIGSLQQGIKSSEAEGQIGFADTLRKQLEVALQKQAQLTTEVENNTKAYNDATNAAEDFFKTQAKAQALVQNNVPAPVPSVTQLALPFQEPGAQLSLFDQIPQGISQAVGETTDQFNQLKDAIAAVDEQMKGLDETSKEFQQLTVFRNFLTSITQLHDSLNLVGDSSEEARSKLTKYRDELQQSVNVMKLYSTTLDKSSSEYKTIQSQEQQLEAILKIYNTSLEQTANVVEKTETKHISFRQQLLKLRNEMGALSEAGKEDTEQFQKMEIEAAHLSELYRIQQNRIRILSSETKALDFGKSAVTGAIAGFQTLASVEVLFGTKQEEIEKITLKLFAAMQLLNGIEELERLTKRDSVIVTLTQTAATRAYTAVVGAATGASKLFRLALLTTGVGAVLVGIGLLVKKFIELKNAQEEAGRASKITAEINSKAVDGYAEQVTNLELLKRRLTDANIPLQERIDLVKEYNKLADDGNKIDVTQVTNTDAVTAAINRQIEAIRERSTRVAADQITTEKSSTLLKDQQTAIEEAAKSATTTIAKPGGTIAIRNLVSVSIEDINTLEKARTTLARITKQRKEVSDQVDKETKGLGALSKETADEFVALKKTETALIAVTRDYKDYNAALEIAAKLTAGLTPTEQFAVGTLGRAIEDKKKQIDDLKQAQANAALSQRESFQAKIDLAEKELAALEGKKDTTATKAEDVFQSEFDALTTKKAELEAQIDTSVASISAKFQAALTQELDKISKLKIPKQKKQILIDLAITVNEEEKNKAIDEFTQRQIDATNKVDDEIKALQDKANTAAVNNLQDQFTKRAAIIDDNQNKEIGDAHRLNDQLLRELDKDKQAGLLTEQQYQEDRRKTIENSEQLINQITIKFSRERQELAIQTFAQNLQRFDDAVEQIVSTSNTRIAEIVREQSQRFISGSINFATFQKNVQDQTRLIQSQQRDDILKQRRRELLEVQLQLDTVVNTTTQAYAELKKKRQTLSDEVTALEKSDAEADAADVQARTQSRIDSIVAYADAIGSVATSVIGFWQAANDAEERALERSIALQQRRVDEAIRIADKGNATYLKAESDRLKQLEIERENAARRQLGVDAALQASQILVGITGAIAKIGTGTPAETIADIAIIIGALATGYGLIKQLQANQPRFKEGTTYVGLGTNKPGVDTVPAWLNEGEAVIPTPKNKKYKKAVEAIYHEKIPADAMNEFVTNYVSKKEGKTSAESDVTKVTNLVTKVTNLSDNRDIKNDIFSDVENYVNNGRSTQYSDIIDRVLKEDSALNESRDIKTISEKVLNKITYENFVSNVSKVSSKALTKFIEEHKDIKVYKERGFFKGVLDAPATHAMLTEGEAVIPTQTNRLYRPVIEAVYNEKVPAEVMNSFVRGYKPSMSEKEYSKLDERSKLVYTLYNVTKKHFGQMYDRKLINKVKSDELKSYTETINNVFNKQSAEKNLTITQIPEVMRDIVFEAHKTISPFKMDRIRDTIHEKSLINFIDNFYELKQAPQPNYEHIAAINEIKMGHDGRMSLALQEQNDLIKQNNEHHKETQKILKAMGISMTIDKNGVAAIAMDAIKQKQIDAKL